MTILIKLDAGWHFTEAGKQLYEQLGFKFELRPEIAEYGILLQDGTVDPEFVVEDIYQLAEASRTGVSIVLSNLEDLFGIVRLVNQDDKTVEIVHAGLIRIIEHGL